MHRKQLAIEVWGEGRYLPVVMMAQNTASAASTCHQLLEYVQRADGPWLLATSQANEITLPNWLQMYRDRLRCEGAVWHFLESPSDPDLADSTVVLWPELKAAFEAEFQAALTKGILDGVTEEQKQRADRRLRVYYKRYHLPSIARQFTDEAAPKLVVNNLWPQKAVRFYAR